MPLARSLLKHRQNSHSGAVYTSAGIQRRYVGHFSTDTDAFNPRMVLWGTVGSLATQLIVTDIVHMRTIMLESSRSGYFDSSLSCLCDQVDNFLSVALACSFCFQVVDWSTV
jgi:hypothetical protein